MTADQLEMLKRLNVKDISEADCSKEDMDILYFLEGQYFAYRPDPYGKPKIFVISQRGKAELSRIGKGRKKEIYDWIRYGITTAIAIAAFIKSFFFVS